MVVSLAQHREPQDGFVLPQLDIECGYNLSEIILSSLVVIELVPQGRRYGSPVDACQTTVSTDGPARNP